MITGNAQHHRSIATTAVAVITIVAVLFAALLINPLNSNAASPVGTSGVKCPTETMVKGSPQNIGGKISSGSKITRVEIGIVKDGKWLAGHKLDVKVNAKTFDIGKVANPKIRFGDLKAGTYYYRALAWVGGKAYKVIDKKFVVAWGNYVYYSDDYNGYTFTQFGWKHFNSAGCAMTATAMVISNKKCKKVTPDNIYTANGYSGYSSVCPDISWSKVASAYGLRHTAKGVSTENQIKSYAVKYPQGVIVESSNRYGWHYFVARYKGGKLYYNDPAPFNSNMNNGVAARDHLKLSEVYPGAKTLKRVHIYY